MMAKVLKLPKCEEPRFVSLPLNDLEDRPGWTGQYDPTPLVQLNIV